MLGSGQAKGWLAGGGAGCLVGWGTDESEEGEREESCSQEERASESAFETICGRSRVRLRPVARLWGVEIITSGYPYSLVIEINQAFSRCFLFFCFIHQKKSSFIWPRKWVAFHWKHRTPNL